MQMTPENTPDNSAASQPAIPPAERSQQLEPAEPMERKSELHNSELHNSELRNEPNRPGPDVPLKQSWQARLLGVSFAIFAFEIGLALVIFPWMGSAWDSNYFQSFWPILGNIWDEPYFRGAVSGLGLVNIYIAMLQIGRVFRRTT
jgi:hypothetical protein